ncbi:MAG: ABC transporter permease [Anaerolineaceae bacterium]
MATTTDTIIHYKKYETVSPTRQRVLGVIFLAIAILTYFLFTQDTTFGQVSTFGMTPGGITQGVAGDWVVPSHLVILIFNILTAVAAVYQLIKGFGKYTNLALGLLLFAFVFDFLLWASAGKSMNLAGMLSASVLLAVPIILGSYSGILCERAGVVNIAIEGMMLMAAMVGALVGSVSHSIWIGLIAAILSSMLLAYVHAVLSIKYKIDQIISGTVINIFSTGMTSFLSSKFLQTYQELNATPVFTRIPIPLLADIPVIGPLFFNSNLFVYMMYIVMIVLQISLFRTKWGLRLRSVGEHPKAADTLGINVFKTRYMAVILGGMVAGIAGAFFTLGSVGRFDEGMTAGQGFIGLAAMIFGNWTPVGSFGAGLLFGFAGAISSKLTILGTGIPPQFMGMAPYLTTMVVLAGIVGRGQGPAADGIPYEKE